jgi:signal transduction histidine kinase
MRMRSSLKKPLLISFIISIVLFAVVFIGCTENEKNEGTSLIEESLDFMKSQCDRYDNQIVTSETKSQIALLDKLRELSRYLSEVDSNDIDNRISEFAENQRITGIIILNEAGEYVTGVYNDGKSYEDCEYLLQDENVLQIIDYPQKNYLSYIEKDDGSVYDYVAVSMQGQKGIIFGYIRESENEIADRESGIINMLTGYKLEMGGIMVITRDERILTTNTDVYPDLEVCNELLGKENGTLVEFNGEKYISGSAKSDDYQFFVFFPINQIYRQRTVVLAYVILFYFLYVALFLFARQRTMQNAESQRLKFLRQMSHDIRTPINGIRGMIRIANSCPEDLEKQKICHQKIWEASDLLIDLVNDVLDMGKLNINEARLEEKPFDMHEIVESTIAITEGAAEHRGISIKVERMEANHWHLIGSPIHVSRILNNILSNAIKYNKDNGTVKLSCFEINEGQTEGKATFEFICADTGIGMDKEFQKHMFEQFAQENAVDEVEHHGTGLGLTIAKSLIDQMHGTITCESKRDEGTTFTIELTFAIDPNSDENLSKEIEAGVNNEDSLNGVSVLLVEDNEMNMEIAEFILEEMGMNITEARNGKEAVDIFSESISGAFDIILMDMMMPVMNGEEATRQIRLLDHPDAKSIPIIAATANAFAEDIEAAHAAGMNDHLAKPLDVQPLRQMIVKYVVAAKSA